MKFHRKLLLALFISVFIFTAGWNVWLYTLPHHATAWNFLYNFVYGMSYFIGGIIAVFYATAFGIKSNLGKMLLFLGLGLISFWAGNIIWVYYTFFLLTEIPYPSFADLFYSMYYPFMAIGAFYMMKIYQNLISRNVIRDSAIIAIVSLVGIYSFFARPDISSDLSLIEKIINIYYPFGDVLTITIALVAIRIGSGKIHPSLYIFAFGMMLQGTADLLFLYRTSIGVYWNGDIADTFFACSAFFTSIGLFEIINSLLQASPVTSAPIPPKPEIRIISEAAVQ